MSDLLFLCGSLRAASSSTALAEALIARCPEGTTARRHDIGALPHYNADVTDDPTVEALIGAVREADGVVFVTPEYNYSVPGVLKNAIDWASRPAYESVFLRKPCLVMTVSGGALGGVRAQAHLKYVLNGMLARVHVGKEVVVPFANKKVEDGRFTDEEILTFAGTELAAFVEGLAE